MSLPVPNFSADNPYWQDPNVRYSWLKAAYRPRLTAQDFLYATMWEMERKYDVHGAACVKMAKIVTVKANWYFGLRRSIGLCLANQRRTT